MKKIWSIDIGSLVLCDQCNRDYSESDERGGLIFNGHAVCPRCEPRMRGSIAMYGEERYITAEAEEGESFRDMVLRARGGNNTITLYSSDDDEEE